MSKVVFLLLIALVCSGCDTGFNLSELFEPNNFVWASSETEPEQFAESFYLSHNDFVYAIIIQHGKGQMSNVSKNVLLCFAKEEDSTCVLKNGIVFGWFESYDIESKVSFDEPLRQSYLLSYGILEQANITPVKMTNKNSINLKYRGQLESFVGTTSLSTPDTWLCFDVDSKYDPQKVIDHIDQMLPVIKKHISGNSTVEMWVEMGKLKRHFKRN